LIIQRWAFDIVHIIFADFLGKQHFSKVDLYGILAGILDGSKFHEFKAFYGVGLISGYGYING